MATKPELWGIGDSVNITLDHESVDGVILFIDQDSVMIKSHDGYKVEYQRSQIKRIKQIHAVSNMEIVQPIKPSTDAQADNLMDQVVIETAKTTIRESYFGLLHEAESKSLGIQVTLESIRDYEKVFKERHPNRLSSFQSAVGSFVFALTSSRIELDIHNTCNKTLPSIRKLKTLFDDTHEEELLRIIAFIYSKQTDRAKRRSSCLKEGVEYLFSVGKDDIAYAFLRTNGELPYLLEPWRALIHAPSLLVSAIKDSLFTQSKEHCSSLRLIIEEIGTAQSIPNIVVSQVLYALLIKLAPNLTSMESISKLEPDSIASRNSLVETLCKVLTKYTGHGYIILYSYGGGGRLVAKDGYDWSMISFEAPPSMILKVGDLCKYSRIVGEEKAQVESVSTPETPQMQNLKKLSTQLPNNEIGRYVEETLKRNSKVKEPQKTQYAHNVVSKKPSSKPLSSPTHSETNQQRITTVLSPRTPSSYSQLSQFLIAAKSADEIRALIPFYHKYADMDNPTRFLAIKMLIEVNCRKTIGDYAEAVRIVEKYQYLFDENPSHRLSFKRICVGAFIGAGRYKEAIECLNIIEYTESNNANRTRLAYCHLKLKNYNETIRISDSILNAWPRPADADISPAYSYKFNALVETAAFDEAQRLLEEFSRITKNDLKISEMQARLEQRMVGTASDDDLQIAINDYEIIKSDEQSFILEEVLTPHLNYLLDETDFTSIKNRTADEVNRQTWIARSYGNAKKIINGLSKELSEINTHHDIRYGVFPEVIKVRLTIAGACRISLQELQSEELQEGNAELRSQLAMSAARAYWCMATIDRKNAVMPQECVMFYYLECIRLFSMLTVRNKDYPYEFYDALNTYIANEANLTSYTSILPYRSEDSKARYPEAVKTVFATMKTAIDSNSKIAAKVIAKLVFHCRPITEFLLNAHSLEHAGIDMVSCFQSITDNENENNDARSLLGLHLKKMEEHRKQITSVAEVLCAELHKKLNTEQLRLQTERFQSIISMDDLSYLSVRDVEHCNEIISYLYRYCDLSTSSDYDIQQHLCTEIGSQAEALEKDMIERPTSFSFSSLVALARRLSAATKIFSAEIAKASAPQLTILNEREVYAPHNHSISVQLRIKNRDGCTSAQQVAVKLVWNDSLRESVYCLDEDRKYRVDTPIRGGDEKIITIDLPLTEHGETPDQVFELGYIISYTTIQSEPMENTRETINIHIIDPHAFQNIRNLYTDSPLKPDDNTRSLFYGRREEIETICDSLLSRDRAGQTFILYGQYRTGKTSLINFVVNALTEQSHSVLVARSGDIKANWTYADTCKRFVVVICSTLVKAGYLVPDELTAFTHMAFDSSNYDSHLVSFMDLLHSFIRLQSDPPRIILTADEFGRAIKGDDSLAFFELWKEVMEIGAIDAIFAGHDIITQLIQKHTNPFGTTRLHQVNYIRPDAMRELINKPMEYETNGVKQFRCKEEVVERIIELTGGNVYIIQMICQNLVQYMNRNKINRVNIKDFDDCMSIWVDEMDDNARRKLCHGLYDAGEPEQDNTRITNDENICVLNTIARINRRGRQDKPIDFTTGLLNAYGGLFFERERVDKVINSLFARKVIDKDDAKSNYYVRVRFYEEYLVDKFEHLVRQHSTGGIVSV
ncbi:hypothetical protein LJC74_07550 [Eubacteriales bacterium OttesenSCG-928-A19]|nr:hypothetical protein [Eubacteriales bacterium OttesenSCG-928-A19]